MHFSIPDTQEIKDDHSGASYTVYNIHINGVFHCSARYKQLRQFHEQLRKEFGPNGLPAFPPKRLLSLTPNEVEERRTMLEKYIQLVSQDPAMGSSSIFNTFLHSAQQDSQKEIPEKVTLDVCLMNGHKITVNVVSTDQTDSVLEAVASQIEIPDDLVYYFGLYLVKKEGAESMSIVRKLQDFEAPYISLRTASKDGGLHRIVLRKSYWDSSFDDDLLENKVTLNLLFVQVQNDLDRGWILTTAEQMSHLQKLIKKGSKKEFLRFARTLKYYGYVQFHPCVTDYPEPNTRVVVEAGGKELSFRIQIDDLLKEGSFKITRMRCWRITTIYPKDGDSSPPQLELSFEYLMSRDSLKWIALRTQQAMLMSMCLQSMVDELIMKKHGRRFKRPQDKQQSRSVKGKSSTPTDSSDDKMKAADDKVTQNSAFEEIGDEDL